jgi:hypothetical protein
MHFILQYHLLACSTRSGDSVETQSMYYDSLSHKSVANFITSCSIVLLTNELLPNNASSQKCVLIMSKLYVH